MGTPLIGYLTEYRGDATGFDRVLLEQLLATARAWDAVLTEAKDAARQAQAPQPPPPPPQPRQDVLLTIPQVAEMLRVSRSTLWRLRVLGQLRTVRIAGAVRFRREDVERLMSSQCRRARDTMTRRRGARTEPYST